MRRRLTNVAPGGRGYIARSAATKWRAALQAGASMPFPSRSCFKSLALPADVANSGDGGAAAVATGLPASGWSLLCVGRLWPWLQTRLHASRATIWTPWGAPMHSVQPYGVGIAKVRRSAPPSSIRQCKCATALFLSTCFHCQRVLLRSQANLFLYFMERQRKIRCVV